MLKLLLAILGLLVTANSAFSQTRVIGNETDKIVRGAVLPSLCQIGDVFYLTSGAAGQYNCTAIDIWTKITALGELPVGTSNQYLKTNAGATSLEHVTLGVGTTGTDFGIAHGANSTTFNLPDASATARGAITTGTQTFAGAKTFSSTTLVKNLNGIRYADQFPGPDAGAKISAAITDITDLPVTGGIVDGIGLQEAQVISSTVNVGTSTKSITLLLGCATFSGSANPLFRLEAKSQIVMQPCTIIRSTSTNTAILIDRGAYVADMSINILGGGTIDGNALGLKGIYIRDAGNITIDAKVTRWRTCGICFGGATAAGQNIDIRGTVADNIGAGILQAETNFLNVLQVSASVFNNQGGGVVLVLEAKHVGLTGNFESNGISGTGTTTAGATGVCPQRCLTWVSGFGGAIFNTDMNIIQSTIRVNGSRNDIVKVWSSTLIQLDQNPGDNAVPVTYSIGHEIELQSTRNGTINGYFETNNPAADYRAIYLGGDAAGYTTNVTITGVFFNNSPNFGSAIELQGTTQGASQIVLSHSFFSGFSTAIDTTGYGNSLYGLGVSQDFLTIISPAFNNNTTNIAKLDAGASQTYRLIRGSSGHVAVAFSATPTFDASLGSSFKITLTGNVTSSTLSNVQVGQQISLVICQDATGGRTFVWPTNIKYPGVISGTLNECSEQEFVYDGTSARAVGPLKNSENVAINPDAGAANNFLTAVSSAGVISKAQPAFSNLSGTATLAQLPFGTANQILGTNAGGTAQEHKTLAVGTTGTDFAIAHGAGTTTFNLPSASATTRGALTSADWTTFNNKENVLTFNAPISRSVNTISLLTIPETLGGTNQTTYALGDLVYSSATDTLAKLAGNITTTRKFLRQTGTGAVSAAPAWDTIQAGDVPTLNQNTTGTAANVTGTVAVANGGTGTASTLTGLVRGSATAMTAAELSGAVITSGSNVTTLYAAARARGFGGQFGSTDSGAGVLVTGMVRYTSVIDFACTIYNYRIMISPADTATFKVWKVAAGTALPTVANVINTSGLSISTGTLLESTTVSDFTTTAVTAGDVAAITITAVGGTATFASLQVGCQI